MSPARVCASFFGMKSSNLPVFLDNPPNSFLITKSVARALVRYRLRSSRKIFQFLDIFGVFDRKVARFSLTNKYSIFVPLYRGERWDRQDLLSYETSLLDQLASIANSFPGNVTIIDCGADIGLVSVALADRLDNLVQIVAFEPNDEAFAVLAKNLSSLPISSQPYNFGVSDFSGLGALETPAYDASHHARYVVQVERDGFPVTTIDALSIEVEFLLLKIDVEGGELAVIKGAADTIRSSKAAVISVEAHPMVFSRTGIDPILFLRELQSIRPFRFTIAEEPNIQIALDKPFFPQITSDSQVNVLCETI